jgi:hypothetical protein
LRTIAGSIGGARIVVQPFSNTTGERIAAGDTLPPPVGEGTDITGALEAVSRRYRTDNMAAVVLLSDGRVTRSMTTAGINFPAPVFTVGFGDTLEPADVSIAAIDYDRSIYMGTKAEIGIRIDYTSVSRDSISVELRHGGSVIDRFRGIVSGDGSIEAMMEFTPREEGAYRLEAVVQRLEGENMEHNNSEQFRVNVLPDRLNILMIERHPDWNTSFIRNIASKSRRLDLRLVTWEPERGYHPVGESVEWSFPPTADAMSRYDLVIIGSEADLLGRVNAGILERYVKGGGSILMISSEKSPLRSPATLALLEDFLPVHRISTVTVETGEYYVRPSGPVSWISAEAGYENLPPLLATLSGLAPTAGAEVHLELTGEGRDRPLIVIERQEAGLSGVLLGYPIWRWMLAGTGGHEFYTGFLSGLIHYMAEGYEQSELSVDTDRTVYRTGERPRVTVFLKHAYRNASIRGEIVEKGSADSGMIEAFIPRPDPERPGVYEAVLQPPPAGNYLIRVFADAGGNLTAEGGTEIGIEPVSVEYLKTSRDQYFLRRIADDSGAEAVEYSRVEALDGLIDLAEDIVEVRTVRKMRDGIFFFILSIVFFCLEWLLRKLWGLV